MHQEGEFRWEQEDIPQPFYVTLCEILIFSFFCIGSSSGVGIVTAREMAKRGARVIMACRNLKKAEPIRKDIEGKTVYFMMTSHIAKLIQCIHYRGIIWLTSIRNIRSVSNLRGQNDFFFDKTDVLERDVNQ